jgi:hypothetical protein
MLKNLASLVCALALLVVLPAANADDGLNATMNATGNITLNNTQNLTGSINLNQSEDATQSITPENATEGEVGSQIPSLVAGTQNSGHKKVLRAGFEKTKPLNNLDVYGNKSTYNIPSSTSRKSAFDLSQRLGNVSKFTYNTDIYKPIYNISQYSRTKPLYQVPDGLGSKPVYSISGYPTMKAASSIP